MKNGGKNKSVAFIILVSVVDGDAQTDHDHIPSHRCAKAVPQILGLCDVTHQ